ncbi:MAG: formylglycine-generating enzyme family protein [Thermoguttaceae bacterium]|nr:formylglycine-generating enzyme family protein [Thermoguttaceae bacterium]
MRKMVKMNGRVEASICVSRGRQSRSTRRWSTAFLAVALGLATLGASASFVASTLQADEPREWKGRFGATVATGTLDVERTDAELVAANAADADVTKPKTVYFRDESGKLVKYNYAWLSPADRAEVDFALGLAAATVEETDADDVGLPAAEAPADEPAEVASSQQATVTLVDGKPVLLLSGGASSAGVSAENSEVAWDANPAAGTRKVLTVDGVEYAFRYCPAGTFTMGCPESERAGLEYVDDEAPQHEVTLTRGFWTLETEVTQAMYEATTGANPSRFSASGDGSDSVASLDTSRFPVENVSWNDAQKFIAKLNAGGFAPDGFVFRLPTEAEWEYACRAGTDTPYFWGATLNGDKANCNGNHPYGTTTEGAYLGRTTAVGSYDANGWGLRDMHGNVCEWCSDWLGDYASDSQTDPTGPKSGLARILRGGCWFNGAKLCRSAYRNYNDPTNRYYAYGFRLVLGRELSRALQEWKTSAETIASDEPTSFVTVPVSTYFKAQEMAVFRMQIPAAMNLFQASEGRYPNSEEEFRTKIIKANQIVLPKLPEGDVYFYDVQARELKIRSKKPN